MAALQVELPDDARAELWALLDTLSPEQVREYAGYVKRGEIDGGDYGIEGCACIVGTIAVVNGVFAPAYIGDFIDSHRLRITGNDNKYTVLETFAEYIGRGDTPATNAHSAALYRAVLSYMASRAAEKQQAAGNGGEG